MRAHPAALSGVAIRKAVTADEAALPLFLKHRHSSPAVHQWAEVVLAALTQAGCTGKTRAIALRAIISYVVGALQAQHHAPLSGAATREMANLAAAGFPLLAETAASARSVHPDTEFRQGLAILLDGIEGQQRRAVGETTPLSS